MAALATAMHRNREPLMHCAVYLDLAAKDLEGLRTLRDEVGSELVRSRLAYDRLLLKQREGFLSANPAGRSALGTQFERVLPASSVANLYPNNYSGKTDPQGFYIKDHTDLLWRLFWEISLAVRNLKLDGDQMLPELYPDELSEMRRFITDILDGDGGTEARRAEILNALDKFLAVYPYDSFI